MAGEPNMYKTGGSTSTVDAQTGSKQVQEYYYIKKALIEAAKEKYFGQLADVTQMPKHHGKSIRVYHYMPLLDDRNKNDQGIDASGTVIANGNLYGSSRDIGTIPGKLPVLREQGGQVNRVGFSRKLIQGTMANYGIYHQFTQDSIQFDSDEELLEHFNRELIVGANQLSEDMLQLDLINAAGTIRYTGSATSNATVADIVTYSDLMHLAIDLDNNRTPKQTKIITGTRYIDTRVIPSCRVMFVGSELLPTLRAMKDLHNNPAFIPVQHYAAGTQVLNGEVGSIDMFRIVVVPEMMAWIGAGNTTAAGFYNANGKKNVYPMLVVGDESFTTISFLTDGKTTNFKKIIKKPNDETASNTDPYGKVGFCSLQWWYGFAALRPERIAIIKTAAKL